jgi:hypothetical protein
MLWRWLPSFLFLMSLLLFGAAGYAYYLTTDECGAVIDEPDREFTQLTVGKNEVKYQFHNPTRHTVRVIGCQFC